MKSLNKVEELFEKVGHRNRYQYTVALLFLLLFGSVEFLIICLPFLEAKPVVIISNNQNAIMTNINYTICEHIPYTIEKSMSRHSIVYDFNIYCDTIYTSLIGISLFGGLFVGAFLSFLFTDRIGRRRTLLLFHLLFILCQGSFYFIKNINIIYICLFITGGTISVIVITMMVYTSEIINHANIPIIIATIMSSFSIFGIIYSLLFQFIPDWQLICLIVSGINVVVYLLILLILIESPLFHLTTENKLMFTESMKSIARFNGRRVTDESCDVSGVLNRQLPVTEEEDFIGKKESEEDDDVIRLHFNKREYVKIILENSHDNFEFLVSKGNYNDLFKNIQNSSGSINMSYPREGLISDFTPLDLLRYKSQYKNFVVMCFFWLTVSSTFHGLNNNIKDISNNMQYQLLWPLGIDIICYYLIALISNSFICGRRRTIILLFLISFSSHMVCLISEEKVDSVLYMYCLFISRQAFSCLVCLGYIISNEIYPAVLRTKGLGLNNAMGRLGCMITQLVIEHMDTQNLLKFYLGFAFLGIIFCFFLSETFGKKMTTQLPETILKQRQLNNLENIQRSNLRL